MDKVMQALRRLCKSVSSENKSKLEKALEHRICPFCFGKVHKTYKEGLECCKENMK